MKNSNYKLVAWGAVIGIVGLISFYVLEFKFFDNTIQFEALAIRSFIVAIFIGLMLGWKFYKQGDETVDKIRIWTASLLLPLFFAPLLGSFTNRAFSSKKFENKGFEFIEEKTVSASGTDLLGEGQIKLDGCYLFVFYEGKIERFKLETCNFVGKKRGDIIKLKVKKGCWGYEIVRS